MFSQNFDVKNHLGLSAIKNRIKRKISFIEWFTLLIFLSLTFMLTLYQNSYIYPVDLANYINSIGNNYEQFFYFPYWLPLFYVLEKIPLRIAWLFWSVLNIVCFWFAWRSFGGKIWSWYTATLFFVIFYGQISGILAAGLAAYWIALLLGNWILIGLTALIVITKYTWGVPLVIIFGYLAGITKRKFLLACCIIGVILLISFLIYPKWISDYINRYFTSPPNDQASISLWQYFGPLSLLLWCLPFFIKVEKSKKVALLFFATPLVVPYFQPHDLLVWFSFPLGIFPIFANITFIILPVFGLSGLRILSILPIFFYIMVFFENKRTQNG